MNNTIDDLVSLLGAILFEPDDVKLGALASKDRKPEEIVENNTCAVPQNLANNLLPPQIDKLAISGQNSSKTGQYESKVHHVSSQKCNPKNIAPFKAKGERQNKKQKHATKKDKGESKKVTSKTRKTKSRKNRQKYNKVEKVIRKGKEYEKIVVDLTVIRVTTMIRFSFQQDQSISETVLGQICPFCGTSFPSERTLTDHLQSAHGSDFSLAPLLQIDVRNHTISREVLQIKLEQLPHHDESYFRLTITNCTAITLLLKSVYIFDGDESLLPVFVGEGVLRMKPGFYFEDEIHLMVGDDFVQSLLLTVHPIDGERLPYDVVEQYHIKKVSAKRTRLVGTPLSLPHLPHYGIPTPIRLLHENNFKRRGAYGSAELAILRDFEAAKNPVSLNNDNYAGQLSLLNRIEAESLRHEFEEYTIQRPKLKFLKILKKFKDGILYEQVLYALSIDQFGTRPSLISEDTYVSVGVEKDLEYTAYKGTVESVEANAILILLADVIPVANVVCIEFFFNKTTFQLEQQALSRLAECRKEKILFPTGEDAQFRDGIEEITSFHWINIGIASNEEQMVAVRSIVNRTSFPAPYILFGPPGTGKSSTLVEAIGQIYKHHPADNILVVAPSNFAANEITARILAVVPENHVFRFFSSKCSRKVDDIDKNILQVSNMVNKEYDLPCYEDIYLSRVVVATLATSGRLVQAKIADKHFQYVIVDECGSAKEVSALVPIGGLATCQDEIHASIVLAGDPKQLGPVIRCDYLRQTNHNISLLERIMKLDLYAMNRTTKEYNNRFITQLRDNFRSHSKLLNFPNNAFYDGQLRAKAAAELTNWALGWKRLPNSKCPLLFHSIAGNVNQDEAGFSLYNVEECELVLDYLADILTNGINGRHVEQRDIGVVSPYASQVLHLRTLCKMRRWSDVEIGSAEQYQGREKAIIIMSTVRSRCKFVGFLADQRRLNVSVTRARALLIVIGDATTLRTNANWKQFINYCRRNKAFIDGDKKLPWKKSIQQNTKASNCKKPHESSKTPPIALQEGSSVSQKRSASKKETHKSQVAQSKAKQPKKSNQENKSVVTEGGDKSYENAKASNIGQINGNSVQQKLSGMKKKAPKCQDTKSKAKPVKTAIQENKEVPTVGSENANDPITVQTKGNSVPHKLSGTEKKAPPKHHYPKSKPKPAKKANQKNENLPTVGYDKSPENDRSKGNLVQPNTNAKANDGSANSSKQFRTAQQLNGMIENLSSSERQGSSDTPRISQAEKKQE